MTAPPMHWRPFSHRLLRFPLRGRKVSISWPLQNLGCNCTPNKSPLENPVELHLPAPGISLTYGVLIDFKAAIDFKVHFSVVR